MFLGRQQRQRLCISYHVIVILKFYQLLFSLVGFVRLKYERKSCSYSLASGSNSTAKCVGASFLIWTLLLAMTCVYARKDLHVFIMAFTLLLLSLNQSIYYLRRKSNMVRDVDVLNRFLHMVQHVQQLTGRQTKLSWFILLQVLFKAGALTNFVRTVLLNSYDMSRPVAFFYVSISIIVALLLKEAPNHIFFIGISVLEKSYEQLNLELKIANITLQQTLRMHDLTAKAQLNRKIYAMRRLYGELGKLSQDFMCSIQLHLFLTCLYDGLVLVLVFLNRHRRHAHHQNWWSGWPTALACLNNLRFLCTAFESITRCAHFPYNVNDRDLSYLTNCEFGCCLSLILAQTTLAVNTATLAQYNAGQRYLHYKDYFLPLLTQPVFTFYGMMTLNKRLFFRIFFFYCSMVYIFYVSRGQK